MAQGLKFAAIQEVGKTLIFKNQGVCVMGLVKFPSSSICPEEKSKELYFSR